MVMIAQADVSHKFAHFRSGNVNGNDEARPGRPIDKKI